MAFLGPSVACLDKQATSTRCGERQQRDFIKYIKPMLFS